MRVAGEDIEVRYYEESFALVGKRPVIAHERMFNEIGEHMHTHIGGVWDPDKFLFHLPSEGQGGAPGFVEFKKDHGTTAK